MILLTILFLALMEVSLSFDNAIINAKILGKMNARWQDRFIIWGMPIAVVGMRFLFPIVIVSAMTQLSMVDTLSLALHNPDEYSNQLTSAKASIDAFGGIFLLMIFIHFLMDKEKEVHWIKWLEKSLVNFDELKIFFVGAIICTLTYFRPDLGIIGLASATIYFFINGISDFLETDASAIRSGFISFLYLELIDASCSFDGVMGAFVLTRNIFIIMLGLGIGALVIRSLTLRLVHGGELKEYIYLEHGAHYGIGALALIMLADIFVNVPEPITGMCGLAFIGLSMYSSIKRRQ